MGFYGKSIGNPLKTELYFNLKYSSRFQMDKHCVGDGVAAGSYVLIEYDYSWDESGINIAGTTQDLLPQVYKGNDGLFYTDADLNPSHQYIPTEEVFFSVISDIVTNSGVSQREYEYWLYTKNIETGEYEYIYLTKAAAQNAGVNYVINFNLDVEKYKHSRGYDSTVWQKVYTEGVPSYVQIAELNSVTPTFRVDVDAPTPIPRPPHFAADSTNVLYTLHLQPSWGLRVAKSTNGKSDVKGDYYLYNQNTEQYEKQTNQNLSIYYNKAGFNKNYHNKVSDSNNEISLKQASSGQKYIKLDHEDNLVNYPTSVTEKDLYEFNCLLPVIGNTICELYDLAYGYEGKGSIEYSTGKARYTDIKWREPDSTESIRLRTTDLETVAGCINYTHDLMGMIIFDLSGNNELPTLMPENHKGKIVKINDDYYRTYSYGEIKQVTNTTSTDLDWYILLDDDSVDKYDSTYIPSLKWYNTASLGYQENLNLVYLDNNNPVFKYVKMDGFAEKLNTIHGCLMRVSEILGDDLPDETRDEKTVKGIINRLSDVIDLFGKVRKLEIAVTNPKGIIQTAPIEGSGWINASFELNNDSTEINKILINHKEYHSVDYNFTKNNSTDGQLSFAAITSLKYDKAGHITELLADNINIPFNFKTINGVEASQLDDAITIQGDNKWLKAEGDNTNKTVVVSHIGQNINEIEKQTYNLNNNESFAIQKLNYDSNTGHIISYQNDSYIMPSNFNTIKNFIDYSYAIVSGNDFVYEKGKYYYLDNNSYLLDESDAATDGRDYYKKIISENNIVLNEGNVVANKDNNFTINLHSGNKWIKINSNKDILTFGHEIFPENSALVTKEGAMTFNSTIEIPYLVYDIAGHIITGDIVSYTLPGFILSETEMDSDSTNVIVDYSINNDGKYSKKSLSIGELPIGEQYKTDGIEFKDIQKTDNLNTIIAAFENKIKDLENRIKTLEGNN